MTDWAWRSVAVGLVRMSALAALSIPLAGCPSEQNPVLSNEQFPGEEHDARLLLDPQQDREVVSAMRTATSDGTKPYPLERAPDGMRWSDVPLAVSIAAGKAEVGVVSSEQSADGNTWTFRLVTLEAAPVSLVIERKPPPDMFLATATVGSFGERKAEAERLLREFRMTIKDLGRKRKPESGAS